MQVEPHSLFAATVFALVVAQHSPSFATVLAFSAVQVEPHSLFAATVFALVAAQHSPSFATVLAFSAVQAEPHSSVFFATIWAFLVGHVVPQPFFSTATGRAFAFSATQQVSLATFVALAASVCAAQQVCFSPDWPDCARVAAEPMPRTRTTAARVWRSFFIEMIKGAASRPPKSPARGRRGLVPGSAGASHRSGRRCGVTTSSSAERPES